MVALLPLLAVSGFAAVFSGVSAAEVNESIQPSLPSLPAAPQPGLGDLPPLDLSPEGLEALLKELTEALLGSPPLGNLLPDLEKPLTGLLSLLEKILKAAEGLLLPAKEAEDASRLTNSLRRVFSQQSLIKEKLAALQSMVAEGGLSNRELRSLQDIGDRLLQQLKELEAFGLKILKDLTNLILSVFPDLKPILPTPPDVEAQQEETLRAARALFPDILKP